MKSRLSALAGSGLMRRLALAGAVLGVSTLTGCYVVPLNQVSQPAPPVAYVAPAPASMTFSARLYPSNPAAAVYGVVGAVVTNDLDGHGTFSTQINGESFSGEATRLSGSSAHQGVANGAGSRGGYISCSYQMNSATLGMGECRLSNGALFTMHVGS